MLNRAIAILGEGLGEGVVGCCWVGGWGVVDVWMSLVEVYKTVECSVPFGMCLLPLNWIIGLRPAAARRIRVANIVNCGCCGFGGIDKESEVAESFATVGFEGGAVDEGHRGLISMARASRGGERRGDVWRELSPAIVAMSCPHEPKLELEVESYGGLQSSIFYNQ